MILGAPSQANFTVAPAQLTQVAQNLARESESIRIKKLLIYICQQTWPSDVSQIQAIDLKDLLHKLLIMAPAPEKLHAYLHTVVGTLNKSAEYALVAETIIQHVDQLYPPIQARSVDPIQNSHQSVAMLLQQDADQSRMKKLLYLACKNTWLSDPKQLAQLNLIELVRELHHLAATPERLQQVLANRVNKLSKKEEYSAIAKRLFQLLQPLYLYAMPQPETTIVKQDDTTEFLSQLMTRSAASAKADIVSSNSQPPVSYRVRSITEVDLFDVRSELMNATNPLRAKILLFSLLHEPFNPVEHEMMLKSHELNELLRDLFQSYKLLEILETKLTDIAKKIHQPEEYGAVAQVILRSVKPLYSNQNQPAPMQIELTDNITGLVETSTTNSEATRPEQV